MIFLSVCIIRVQCRNHTRYFKQREFNTDDWLEWRGSIEEREATWSLATSRSCYTSKAGGPTSVTKTQQPEPSDTNLTTVEAEQQRLKLQMEGLSSGKWRHKEDTAHIKRGGDVP